MVSLLTTDIGKWVLFIAGHLEDWDTPGKCQSSEVLTQDPEPPFPPPAVLALSSPADPSDGLKQTLCFGLKQAQASWKKVLELRFLYVLWAHVF